VTSPFRSIRMRMAVVYSAVLFVLTALVYLGVYAGLALRGDPPPATIVTQRIVGTAESGLPFKKIILNVDPGASLKTEVQRQADRATLARLRRIGLYTLPVVFVVSLVAGWLLARRLLRPVETITATAEEISATDLSRRIALAGPDDELKRLADAFDSMLGRIDGAFAAQRQFVADASHELRNPIAIIQTNLDVAEDELGPRASVVRRATARMARLVDDLLALARSEGDGRRSRVALVEVGADVAEEFAALAAARGVRFEVSGSGAEVVGDADALRRAVANLVDNAIRVSPPGGLVSIRTGVGPDGVSLVVTDEGPGIPAEEQQRVFERFWRADGSRARSSGGSGLGLAIVRRIVELHDGTVGVESTPGQGARFTIRLPEAAPAPAPQAVVPTA
jgi:signal transduction histidine kinase